jgi:hypothetical protein
VSNNEEEVKELSNEVKVESSTSFVRGNLNTVLGAMTEEWDFWLSEKVNQSQYKENIDHYSQMLSQKQAFFRNTDRGSYILFCEVSQVIDTILCHPRSWIYNPIHIVASSMLYCLSRRVAINGTQNKSQAISAIQNFMNNIPAELTAIFKKYLAHLDQRIDLDAMNEEQKFVKRFFTLQFSYEMPRGMQLQGDHVVRESFEDCLSL